MQEIFVEFGIPVTFLETFLRKFLLKSQGLFLKESLEKSAEILGRIFAEVPMGICQRIPEKILTQMAGGIYKRNF